MTTKWAVTAASERVILDDSRQGETTFTVTNPDSTADRAVFDVVPGEGADASWFSVEDPQRLVRGGASLSYVMKVAVPAEAPPGTYTVQPMVYSADSAPEESSVLGPRVMLEVAAEEKKPQRQWPWWYFVIAGVVVLVLGVVMGVVVGSLGGGGDEPVAGDVTMPDLMGMTEGEAIELLAERSITMRPVMNRHDPERDGTVVGQRPAAGETIQRGRGVIIEVAVELTAPTVLGPTGVVEVTPEEPSPNLQWDPGESLARRWRVALFYEACTLSLAFSANPAGQPYGGYVAEPSCEFRLLEDTTVDIPVASFEMARPTGSFNVDLGVPGEYLTGWYWWNVAPLDDFGTAGPGTGQTYFRISEPRLPEAQS